MEEIIFAEIARELKGLHNTALRFIDEGKLEEAEDYYIRALNITTYLNFYEGMALAYYNLANLEVLRDNKLLALKKLAIAQELYEQAEVESDSCELAIRKMARAIMDIGIVHEAQGELSKALEYYQACFSYVSEDRQQALAYEIDLIKEVISGAKRKNCSNFKSAQSDGYRPD